jgi:RecQ family ATP-dependent DNA helicase
MSYLRKKYIDNSSDSDDVSNGSKEKIIKQSNNIKKSTTCKNKTDNNSTNSNDSAISKKKLNKISDDDLLLSYNKILKKYWGYDGLKQTQFDIIKKMLIDKVDVCAVLATGFGKSLCYQLPHLISGKCVIVVSPLIALMHEQGQEMKNKNVPVAVFNSDTTTKAKNEMKKNILEGENKLIYMTPEYLIKAEDFIKELEDNLAFVCIDEAHAVSTWGLDFRPGYTKLGIIREWVPSIPILTLTATASTKVREDINKILGLVEPECIIGNFDRPNLLIKVLPRYDDIMINISSLLEKYTNEYIIIYCKTREETELLSAKILTTGVACACYHAGMGDIDRQVVQQDFIDGNTKCIIATIAFGMGINIPNVRLVIHYNCPKNMESYYQEIGRAGRDGKPSECVLFYSTKDFKINRYFLQSISNPSQKIYQENQIRKIEKYVFATECRRKIILESFGQEIESCTNCDNCISILKKEPITKKNDYTIEVYMVLNILSKINDKFGTGMTINILLGKKSKVKEWMQSYTEYGSGTVYGGEIWWKELIRHMINDDLIQENQVARAFYTTLALTENGIKIRNNLVSKYPKYINLQTSKIEYEEDDNSSYSKYHIKYPLIKADSKTKILTKVNKSTKTLQKNTQIKVDDSDEEINKLKNSTTKKSSYMISEPVEIEDELEDELDQIISSSFNRKTKFNYDSD